MIQHVVDNLGIDANYIFIVQKEHREKYNLDSMLDLIVPNCTIVEVDGVTEGAACTTLLAEEFINNDQPLFIANSDQYVEWNSLDFMYKMRETNADGGIVTFKSTHPKWSYAKTNSQGHVTRVAEKNPISANATVGFYYWKHGKDFVEYTKEMIDNDIRVNDEFYVCPVFNQAIADNKKIRTYEADEMWGLGTPEDLERYLLGF
jgi:NDP-sugar pyrophosphorylase family protein